ncbi:unnamed protein product [Owenia fusiformis]|uniref:PLAT domain-containing protein n=1 Tax=Owenia fusiformis TaxID=6347 RepID=A0A8S4N077_OWEFU|nr:unnamed protein product [Owenia fusiformis]
MAYIKTETCEKQDMQISMSDGKDNQVFKIAIKCGEYPKNPKDSNCDVITFKPAESDVIIVPYECVADCVCDGDITIGALIRTKKGGRGKRQADNSNTTVEDDDYSDYIDWNTISEAELEDMGIDPDDAGDMPDTDVASVGCKVFNGTDWVSDGCRISPLSTANNTKCDCDLAETPAFTFATSFMVMPNTIDFNAVFANYDFGRNAAVFATLLALLAIYIPIVIWARRNDNKDILRWGVTLLKDNDPDEHYFYIINVYTGMRRGAGTKSKISFILAGQDEDTGVRQLDDGLRTEFGRGTVLRFLCSTPESLGQLKYIRMWHDNSGGGENSSWYLARVLVQDIQTDDTFVFVCGKWLGVEMGDGEIERLIPAAESDTLRTFNHLFDDNARKRVTEDHLWFSILMRPQRSNFTRVQRVSCCLSLLFLTMIANCMFFGQENAVDNPMVISVGPLSFGIHTIWISFISILVVMPVSLVCVELFKRARPRKTQIGTGVNPTDSGDEKPIGCCNKLLHNVPIRGRVYMPIDQEEKTLPYWVAYIGWTLVVLSVVASGFFILLYTQQWGEEKSSQWLSTFMLSFFQSLLVMDPVKVAVIAAALSIIFRKPRLIGDTIEMNTLKEDEEYIQQNTSERNAATRAKYYKPMSKRKIREFRKERHREIALQGLTREIVLYVIFMWIIYSISQSNRDDMSYRITEVLSKSILDDLTTSMKPEGFYETNTRKKFMEWMDEELLPVMFADVDYKGDKLTWKDQLYMEDLANFRVGPMRLRQLRQKEDLSEPNTLEPNVVVNTTDGTPTCERAKYGWYEFGNEEDRDFCLGWKSQPCPPAEAPYSWSSPAWNYTSAFDVWGIPILGLVDTYSGGGYIATLDTTYPIARLTLNEMWKNFWIDRQTRVVFIEFTVYNANINIFTVVTLMAEFPASGGIIPYATLHSFRLYMHEGAQGLYNLACEIIFIIFLGYLIYQQFNVCRRVGRKGYFSAGWHVFDFLTIIGSLIAIVMYFMRYAMTRETMNKFAEDPKAFVDFNHIAQWDQILGWTVAFLVFFFTCKFLRILRFNKRMGWLSAVLSAASKDLANFSFIFFVMLFGFTTFAYVVFGQHVKGFSTMGRSVGSLLAHILGDIQYEDIVTVNVGLAQFFFLFFTGLFTMVLIHMFICIVNIAIYTVKKNTKMVPNEYEVIDYILESFGEWANIKWLMPKRPKKKRDGYDPDSVEALKERRTKVLCELMVQQWVDILHKVDFETKQYVMKVDELANRSPKDPTSPTTSTEENGSKQEDNNRGKESNDVKKDDNISLISESVSREGTGLAEVET